MEGFQELVEISKTCKEIYFIQRCKMDENVKKLLVKEKKGKRSTCERSYFRKRVEMKKVKEVIINGYEVERNCEKWKKFLVSLIIFFCFWE